MSASWVIKLPLNEPENGSILINVQQKESHELDLDLLATDGDAAFRGKVRERSLKKLRNKNYDGTDEEWSGILHHELISKQSAPIKESIKTNLDVSCSVTGNDPKATLTISIRSRVEDIAQRLGTIELSQTSDTDDVDLFGWASQTIDRRDELSQQNEDERQKIEVANETIASLRTQLADLVKQKQEHENELLSKFVAILNTKKAKLRQVQLAVSTGEFNQERLEELETSLDKKRTFNAPRGKKRSATTAEMQQESEESEAFEDMDVAEQGASDEDARSDRSRSRSTVRDETETEDENDLDGPVLSQPASQSAKPSKPSKNDTTTLPPPRDLPFKKKGPEASKKSETSQPAANNTQDEDEETASEDDEL